MSVEVAELHDAARDGKSIGWPCEHAVWGIIAKELYKHGTQRGHSGPHLPYPLFATSLERRLLDSAATGFANEATTGPPT